MSRKQRESYVSMSKTTFLNDKTGPFKRLDNSSWWIKKKKDGSVGYFVDMHTKFQQLPNACFQATCESSKVLDVELIKSDVKKFMEVTDVKE
tara:strand:- start:927 stop:1202 length:276 start_codon:yes stop_codon:yes gene_type:complete